MPVVVVDQPQFVVHVIHLRSGICSLPPLSPSDVITPPYGRYSCNARRPPAAPKIAVTFFIASCMQQRCSFSSIPFTFHRVMTRTRVASGSAGIPDVTARERWRFPRQVHIPPPADNPGRGSARGSSLSLRTSLTSQAIFLISDCYNTQKLVSDN
jgi:hypothetical protein